MKHRNAWKRWTILIVGISLAFGLAACSLVQGTPSATSEPAATPVPLPTAEPVITVGDPMPLTLEDTTAVPAGYTHVETEDATLSLYAFTDEAGAVQYRVYGGYTEFVDGARDFRMMRRCVVDAVLSLGEYHRFSKGIFMWVGFDTVWLEYENVERAAGETKWSFWKLMRYAIEGIISFSVAPK